jgi:hypothetical protein
LFNRFQAYYGWNDNKFPLNQLITIKILSTALVNTTASTGDNDKYFKKLLDMVNLLSVTQITIGCDLQGLSPVDKLLTD